MHLGMVPLVPSGKMLLIQRSMHPIFFTKSAMSMQISAWHHDRDFTWTAQIGCLGLSGKDFVGSTPGILILMVLVLLFVSIMLLLFVYHYVLMHPVRV